ncbi:hypothetical protein BDR26DRAFT_856315 [Obelidium mucronatum]|nr:hypothetical protein BDR26DRAFT_856315 [Obelidium mucronatum]
MYGRNEIRNLSNAAVVDLKAELFKKREEFERSRVSTASLTDAAAASSSEKIKELKKLSDANKRRLEEEHEARYGARKGKGGQHSKGPVSKKDKVKAKEQRAVEEAALEASWVALQRKAKEYDRLKRELSDDEDARDGGDGRKRRLDDKVPLVDFVRKHLNAKDSDNESNSEDEEEDKDPWVEATDAFGRTRIVRKSEAAKLKRETAGGPTFISAESARLHPSDNSNAPQLMSADMSREEQRQRWEQQAMAEISNGKDPLPPPIHFDAQREVRNLGVGFYGFSQQEEERKKQMEALDDLRKDTMGSRERAVQVKEDRKAKLEERKRLLLERKKKKEVAVGAAKVSEDILLEKEGEEAPNDVDSFLKQFS